MDQQRSFNLCMAPLRGVTVRTFRVCFAKWFAPTDRAIAPFIPTVAGERVKPLLLKDIDPALPQSIPVIPQVIGKDPDQLRVLLRAFKALGYTTADLNAGCPWPFVAKKGRGSGLLKDADVLARMLAVGCEEMPGGFSIKVRLGLTHPHLLRTRMSVINQFPLREVAIHARTAQQMYEGQVLLEDFSEALAMCAHPVVYNGDIFTRADFLRLQRRFPTVDRWMLGRGLAMDPFLVEQICAQTDTLPRDMRRLVGFLDDYLQACEAELFGPVSVLGRMKELWGYLKFGFNQGDRIWNGVKICRTLDEYKRIISAIPFEREPFSGYRL